MFSNEEWRDVVGYEGLYQVSNHGRVMRIAGGSGARAGHVLKSYKSERYNRVQLSKNGRIRSHSVQRLVLEAFIGPDLEGREANHKDGNKTNNRLENLEWVTASQNVRHSIDTLGVKRARGERCSLSKLNKNQVKEIRRLLDEGRSREEIARKFGVTSRNIGFIEVGFTWKHIK